MMTERDLLIQLCAFISKKQIVMGDEASIRNMVAVYQNPPFTLAFPAAMRMTLADTYQLNELLKRAHELLTENETIPVSTRVVNVNEKFIDVD